MKGECVDVRAVQGYYPPRLRFNVRLKNDTNNLWYIFGYGGLVQLYEEKIEIGTIDTIFRRFELKPNEERDISPTIELDYRKLDLIEEKRTGDLHLGLLINFLGVYLLPTTPPEFETLEKAMARGLSADSCWIKSPGYGMILIPQSKWVKILEDLGYGKFKIVELQIPTIPSGVLEDAISSFEKAKRKLNEGDYVKVLMNCQDVMDKIGKTVKPVKPKLEQLVGKEKLGRISSFKGVFENFLGLRHEVALEKPIIRKDAELALHTTLAILNYFARRIAELKGK